MLSRKQSTNKKINGTFPSFKLSSSFRVERLEKGFDDRFEHLFNVLVQETLDFYADNMKIEYILKGHTITLSEDCYRQRINDKIKKLHKGNRKHGDIPHRKFMLRIVHEASLEMKKNGYDVEHIPDEYIKIYIIGNDDRNEETYNNDSLNTMNSFNIGFDNEADRLEEDSYFPPKNTQEHPQDYPQEQPQDNPQEETLFPPLADNNNLSNDDIDFKLKSLKKTGINLTK